MRTRTSNGRGQAYALEGLIAALIVAGSVVVGLQAVDTTPWVTGSDDVDAENQRVEAHDILATSADGGSLSRAIRCVDKNGDPHRNVGKPPSGGSLTDFGRILGDTLVERNFEYRVSVAYVDPSASSGRAVTWIEGEALEPSGPTSTATTVVTLTDDMTMYREFQSCGEAEGTLDDEPGYYIPDADTRSAVYNVVEVRLEIWPEGSS